jgi:hypothetical protein
MAVEDHCAVTIHFNEHVIPLDPNWRIRVERD